MAASVCLPIGPLVRPGAWTRSRRVRLAASCACATCVVLGAAEQPSLDRILGQVGAHVRQFEEDFSSVLSDEEYQQDSVAVTSLEAGASARRVTSRRLRSEMLFAWVPELQS